MIFAAVLRLDGDVHEFVVLAKQRAIIIGRSRFVGDDRNNGGEFSNADLPNMEIGHDRVAIAFHRAAYFVRQIGRRWSAVEQDATRVAQKIVGPRKNDSAS